MTAPLQGVRVLEVANWLAAPLAAALMADLGADVIKVEPPRGDPFRGYRPSGVDPDIDFPANFGFELDNRGKRSITVELTAEGGPELVRRLAAAADVFITNLTPQRRGRFGLDIEDVRGVNPRAIYVSLSGYGSEGPDADRLAFDHVAYWARSGVMSLMGEAGTPPPLGRGGQGDHPTAINILAATLVALRMREQTGQGQVVDVSLLGSGIWSISLDMAFALYTRAQPARHNREAPRSPLLNSYRCADGRWLLLSVAQADRVWPRFCRALGRPEWAEDPRYATARERTRHAAGLVQAIDAIFATADLPTWAERLDAAGIIWAPVSTLPEVMEDESVHRLGVFEEVEHPEVGRFSTLAAPFKVRGADIRPRGPAPKPGAHTFEVLHEAGLSADEIADLAAKGVFG